MVSVAPLIASAIARVAGSSLPKPVTLDVTAEAAVHAEA
jgi:hypothetical protein